MEEKVTNLLGSGKSGFRCFDDRQEGWVDGRRAGLLQAAELAQAEAERWQAKTRDAWDDMMYERCDARADELADFADRLRQMAEAAPGTDGPA